MKVLLFNPQYDTLHLLAEGLRQDGAIVLEALVPGDVLPILQMHGRTIDLAILNREGESGRGDVGVQLIREIRAQADQADLPLILTSLNWGDAQFTQHQSTPSACHAYLKLPVESGVLARLVEKVLQVSLPEERGRDEDALRSKRATGESAPAGVEAAPSEGIAISLASAADLPEIGRTVTAQKSGVSAGPVLEDASNLYLNSSGFTRALPSKMTISLEAPLSLSSAPQISFTSEQPAASLPPQSPPELTLVLDEAGTEPLKSPAQPHVPLQVEPADLQLAPDLTPTAAPETFQPEQAQPFVDAAAPLLMSSLERNLSDQQIRNWVQPPVGDAVVPGGATQSPDLETLKRYLMLREQDVATLSAQLRTAQTQVKALSDQLEIEKVRATELIHENERQKQTIRDAELERQAVRDSADTEMEEMRIQMRARGDKMRFLELQVKDASLEMEQLRERVRSDLRRIRVREQELENRLELLKKDSGAQLAAREEKLNEARRRADVLEFNNELLQSQVEKEREASKKLREQLAQVSRMMRMAGGVLEGEESGVAASGSAASAGALGVSHEQKTGRAA